MSDYLMMCAKCSTMVEWPKACPKCAATSAATAPDQGAIKVVAAVATGCPAGESAPVQRFKPWRCEKCWKYHDRLFPVEGCEWCKGSTIAARMGLIPQDNNSDEGRAKRVPSGAGLGS